MSDPLKDVEVLNQLAQMDFLEQQIQEMTSYPEVEQLLRTIIK